MIVSLLVALVALLALSRGYQRPSVILAAHVLSDVSRALSAPLLAPYLKPYTGMGLYLWLGLNVAPYIAPAAVLLAVVVKDWRLPLCALSLASGIVAGGYPALSGQTLLAYYTAVYLAVCGVSLVVMLARGAWKGGSSREELLVLWLVCMTCSTQVAGYLVGVGSWWGVEAINAASVAGVVAGMRWSAGGRGSPPSIPRREPVGG